MIICQFLADLQNFFTGWFPSIFAVKWILNIPPHLAYVATLPCETLMSAQQAINDKLQGSVAIYLRCGGVVNNKIKVYCWLCEWKKILIGENLAMRPFAQTLPLGRSPWSWQAGWHRRHNHPCQILCRFIDWFGGYGVLESPIVPLYIAYSWSPCDSVSIIVLHCGCVRCLCVFIANCRRAYALPVFIYFNDFCQANNQMSSPHFQDW